mmetsp:Transcript_2312/g.4918  ORF Transcript_2312/g.4918 Transcript_2312/m.4918 type:complete len:211 (-) Transcript_2312:326-958(-)
MSTAPSSFFGSASFRAGDRGPALPAVPVLVLDSAAVSSASPSTSTSSPAPGPIPDPSPPSKQASMPIRFRSSLTLSPPFTGPRPKNVDATLSLTVLAASVMPSTAFPSCSEFSLCFLAVASRSLTTSPRPIASHSSISLPSPASLPSASSLLAPSAATSSPSVSRYAASLPANSDLTLARAASALSRPSLLLLEASRLDLRRAKASKVPS